jgi:glycerophosphoryl diester phosphodiesterase
MMSLLWAVFVSVAVPAASDAQPQSDDQQKCINTLNADGAKVARTQGKENASCIKNVGQGKETHPDGCLIRDGKGKIRKVSAKAAANHDNDCLSEAPDFGLADGATGTAAMVNAAVDGELQLLYDVFGMPLSPAIVTDPDGAKCQAAVSKDYEKAAAAYMKGFVKCKKNALKAGADSAAALEACVLDDSRSKAASAMAKLAADIERKCPDNLFPGECVGEPVAGLAACIHELVRCNVCLTQNGMDDLGVDCDVADDGVSNGSCEVPASFTVRRRIERLAPAANIGHRGTGTSRPGHPHPENSLSSFQAAIEQGADGIELDVELTADGELVVMHDDTVDRTTTCTGCVSAFTLAQVQACLLLDGDGGVTAEHPPTLDEIYAILPSDALVNVELKVYGQQCMTPETGPEALAQAAVAEVTGLGVEDRSFFSSFNLSAAAAVKDADASLYSAYLVVIVDGDTLPDATGATLDAIHPLFVVSAEDVSAMRAAGLQVNVWTVNSESAMQQSLDKGVSAIITDEPAILEQVLDVN